MRDALWVAHPTKHLVQGRVELLHAGAGGHVHLRPAEELFLDVPHAPMLVHQLSSPVELPASPT